MQSVVHLQIDVEGDPLRVEGGGTKIGHVIPVNGSLYKAKITEEIMTEGPIRQGKAFLNITDLFYRKGGCPP